MGYWSRQLPAHSYGMYTLNRITVWERIMMILSLCCTLCVLLVCYHGTEILKYVSRFKAISCDNIAKHVIEVEKCHKKNVLGGILVSHKLGNKFILNWWNWWNTCMFRFLKNQYLISIWHQSNIVDKMKISELWLKPHYMSTSYYMNQIAAQIQAHENYPVAWGSSILLSSFHL